MIRAIRCLAGTGISLTAIAGFAAPAAPLAPVDVFERTSSSVMVVRALNENESPIRQGSGVITAAKTVVTHCHVIAKAKQVQVRQGGVSYIAQLEFADIDRDLCQLGVPDLRAPASPAAISLQPLKVGQRIFSVGSPNGRDFAMGDGLIYGIGISPDSSTPPIEITSAVPAGISGGGIFDESGKLVGIASASTAKTSIKGHGLASPAAWIAEIPVRAKLRQAAERNTAAQAVAAAPPPPVRRPSAEELRQAIARATPFRMGRDGTEVKFDSGGWWSFDGGPGTFPRRGHSSVTADAQVCLVQTVPQMQASRLTACYEAEKAESGPTIILVEKERKANP